MKVIFDHYGLPFYLAHGGVQLQIENTKAALEGLCISVDFGRWWDDTQSADIIHSFGRRPPSFVERAHGKGMKVVISEFLGGYNFRVEVFAKRLLSRAMKRLLPPMSIARLNWGTLQIADALVVLTPWEAYLLRTLHGVATERVHVVPNGVREDFNVDRSLSREAGLVSVGTITERKRPLELAQAAISARVPIRFIGSAYGGSESAYVGSFLKLVKDHPEFLRCEGALDHDQMPQIYKRCRGFVLLSARENQSLAALEAAACGCPLLLSDVPWARETFGSKATYCSPTSASDRTARTLRNFYDLAPSCPPPIPPLYWKDVAKKLIRVYESVLSGAKDLR